MRAVIERIKSLSTSTAEARWIELEFRPARDPSAVSETFTRLDAREFFTDFDPVHVELDSLFGPMRFTGFDELAEQQLGYGFVGTRRNRTLAPNWPANLLVIATVNADPVMLDPSTQSEVFFAIHGIGVWRPLPIARDLVSFLELQASWVQMVGEQGDQLADEDPELRPESWARFCELALAAGTSQHYLDNMKRLA